jgi:beta-glucosidase
MCPASSAATAPVSICPKPEEDLLKAARKATKKPLIAVLYNGSALSVNWAAKKADAILESWYGGQDAGTAIADILSGAYNPSGRLPVTFYTGVKDLPAFEDYAMAGRTYRYFKGKPLYPFGYGLSYTSFAYSGLKLTAPALKAGENLGVDVDVKNTGKVAGDEVAQLYLTFPGTPGMPGKALRGLARLNLQPGESRTVHFDLEAARSFQRDGTGRCEGATGRLHAQCRRRPAGLHQSGRFGAAHHRRRADAGAVARP